MNYQGALVRKDVAWTGIVFWFLVRYYPNLSAVLLICLLVSTYWESTTDSVSKVVVYLFNGKIKRTVKTGNAKGKQKAANLQAMVPDITSDCVSADVGYNKKITQIV